MRLLALERCSAALRWLGFCRFERLRSKSKAIDYTAPKAASQVTSEAAKQTLGANGAEGQANTDAGGKAAQA